MSYRFLIFATVATLVAPACGGKAVIDGDSGAAGNGNTTTTTTTTSATSTTSTTTTTGVSDLEIDIVGASWGGGCMPSIPPDPLTATFDVVYNNTAGSSDTTATITEVRFTALGMPTLMTTFDVTPSEVMVPAGEEVLAKHDKVANSAVGDNGCEFCGADEPRLDITVETEGAVLAESFEPFLGGCAY